MKYGDEKLGGAFKDYGGDRGGGRDRYGDRYGDRRDDRRGGYGDRDRSRSPPRRGGYGDRDRDFDPRDERDRSPRAPAPTMTTTGAAAKPRARLPQGGATGATVTTTAAAAAATATAGASADRDPAVDTIREAEADRPETAGAGPRHPSATGAPFVTAPGLPEGAAAAAPRHPSATGAPFVTAPGLPEGAAEAEADRRKRSATGERFATDPDRRPATSATSARRAARGPVNARGRGWRPLGQEGRPRSLPAGRSRLGRPRRSKAEAQPPEAKRKGRRRQRRRGRRFVVPLRRRQAPRTGAQGGWPRLPQGGRGALPRRRQAQGVERGAIAQGGHRVSDGEARRRARRREPQEGDFGQGGCARQARARARR